MLQGTDGAGSANSSPFHKVLHPDSNNVGGAAADDSIPKHIDEPDYYVGSEKLGKIQFSLSYDFQEMTLTLRIIRAIELPAKDFSGTSDPYVKILLLPDKKHKLTTNIKRRNLNPRWNEVFAFEGTYTISSFSPVILQSIFAYPMLFFYFQFFIVIYCFKGTPQNE